MTAINRGIRIEICYAQGIGGDAGARRNFIGNLMGIIRATRGRGLVLSSECGRGVLGCRAPADVVNLMAVWGLGRERGEEGLGVNPRSVVVNEGLKRTSFRGVVDVVYGGEREVEEVQAKKGDGNGVGKKGKRKADPAEDGTPVISKRQAKKMRMEALKADKNASSPSQESTPVEDSARSNTPSTIKAKANG